MRHEISSSEMKKLRSPFAEQSTIIEVGSILRRFQQLGTLGRLDVECGGEEDLLVLRDSRRTWAGKEGDSGRGSG